MGGGKPSRVPELLELFHRWAACSVSHIPHSGRWAAVWHACKHQACYRGGQPAGMVMVAPTARMVAVEMRGGGGVMPGSRG